MLDVLVESQEDNLECAYVVNTFEDPHSECHNVSAINANVIMYLL
jgi:hypothetical protein